MLELLELLRSAHYRAGEATETARATAAFAADDVEHCPEVTPAAYVERLDELVEELALALSAARTALVKARTA